MTSASPLRLMSTRSSWYWATLRILLGHLGLGVEDVQELGLADRELDCLTRARMGLADAIPVHLDGGFHQELARLPSFVRPM